MAVQVQDIGFCPRFHLASSPAVMHMASRHRLRFDFDKVTSQLLPGRTVRIAFVQPVTGNSMPGRLVSTCQRLTIARRVVLQFAVADGLRDVRPDAGRKNHVVVIRGILAMAIDENCISPEIMPQDVNTTASPVEPGTVPGAGSSIEARMAMMAMTTSSSMSVKPDLCCGTPRCCFMAPSVGREREPMEGVELTVDSRPFQIPVTRNTHVRKTPFGAGRESEKNHRYPAGQVVPS